MRDWFGRAWDFVVKSIGGLAINQRWVDYKRWTDFGGSWFPKAYYQLAGHDERFRKPLHKFFWWWLRYAVFIVGGVVERRVLVLLKVLVQGLAIIRIPLQILGLVKFLGGCKLVTKYLVNGSGSIKVQGKSCVTQYVSWQHFKTWQEWANATGGKWYYMCSQ